MLPIEIIVKRKLYFQYRAHMSFSMLTSNTVSEVFPHEDSLTARNTLKPNYIAFNPIVN